MEAIAYHAILSSALLAKERGTYETYKGSKWDRGIFPQDTLTLLEQERGIKIDVPRHETLDWRLVREAVREWGMRNSNTMANAPTAIDRQHRRLLPDHRAHLQKPLREEQHGGRLYGRQRVPGR